MDKQEQTLYEKTDSSHDEQQDGLHVEVIRGSEALANALRLEPPNWHSKALLQLYGFCVVAFLCSTINGGYTNISTHHLMVLIKIRLRRLPHECYS